jgi:hypothetical protein
MELLKTFDVYDLIKLIELLKTFVCSSFRVALKFSKLFIKVCWKNFQECCESEKVINFNLIMLRKTSSVKEFHQFRIQFIFASTGLWQNYRRIKNGIFQDNHSRFDEGKTKLILAVNFITYGITKFSV